MDNFFNLQAMNSGLLKFIKNGNSEIVGLCKTSDADENYLENVEKKVKGRTKLLAFWLVYQYRLGSYQHVN